MTDIVNAYFRRFYPVDLNRQDDSPWQFRGGGYHNGWEYSGPGREHRIFPEMLCADGFSLSVQGHYGAYCYPQDDFSEDPYTLVEVATTRPHSILSEHNKADGIADDFFIYARVPVWLVERVIAAHGGLFDWAAADLGPAA